MALNKNLESFIIYVLTLEATIRLIHPFQGAKLAALYYVKVSTKVFVEYFNYVDVFFLT